MSHDNELFREFLVFSSMLTGFTTFRLRGTGQAEIYFSTTTDIVGEATVRKLLTTFREISDDARDDEAIRDREIRRRIMSDEKLGPVARNLIKLWYVGIWYELPRDWRESFGESEKDHTFVISAAAYTEGLLWPAIGANPSGAKPLGYGTWAFPPRIED